MTCQMGMWYRAPGPAFCSPRPSKVCNMPRLSLSCSFSLVEPVLSKAPLIAFMVLTQFSSKLPYAVSFGRHWEWEGCSFKSHAKEEMWHFECLQARNRGISSLLFWDRRNRTELLPSASIFPNQKKCEGSLRCCFVVILSVMLWNVSKTCEETRPCRGWWAPKKNQMLQRWSWASYWVTTSLHISMRSIPAGRENFAGW